MNVWRKQTIRFRLDGKNVPRGTPNAERIVIESKRFYGTLRTFDGKRKQVPLTEDAKTSRTLLRRLQTEADSERASGVTRQTKERQRPLSELLNDYEKFLSSKGNTERHVTQTIERIQTLLRSLKANTLDELDSSSVSHVLAEWRKRGRIVKRKFRQRENVSVATSNHYARAIKGFTRWLWIERRTSDDVLSPLRLMNATEKRKRRALTVDELQRLLKATCESGKRFRSLRPVDRKMLYTLAMFTGLRASELASLTPESVNMETKTVNVKAGYSKRRRNDTLPLHVSIIEPFIVWLETKAKGKPLFPGTWPERAAKMLRNDLKRAGIAYVDVHGCVTDFHALRHTFVTQLARSGVHPAKAKELARHSTITLTMDVYSHCETEELRNALDSIPPIG